MPTDPDGAAPRQSWLLPLLAILCAMACFQMGAAVAKQLYPAIGPIGAAALRLVLAAIILLAVVQPWRHWPKQPPILPLIGLGLSLGATLLFFYLAIDHLPLGIALSIQVLGPLGVAVATSKRASDLIWVLLAGAGIWCLVGTAPAGKPIDPVGVAFALVAAAGWAGYVLLGRVAGSAFGRGTASLAVGVAALVVFPVGLFSVGPALFDPMILPVALIVALLSAAIPFSLELYAMPRLPARSFAVSMSMEPAFAAMSGLVFLGEVLTPVEMAGIALVIAASAGSVLTGAKAH